MNINYNHVAMLTRNKKNINTFSWKKPILYRTRKVSKYLEEITLSMDRKAWANNVDPDQMLQNVLSDQGLHYHSTNSFGTHQQVVKWTCPRFRRIIVMS